MVLRGGSRGVSRLPSRKFCFVFRKYTDAETANAVVKRRLLAERDSHDGLERFITDAYATAAIAYRRAAGIYVGDKQMEKLGTAAAHLLTMATSRMMAQSKDNSHEAAR